MLHSTELTQHKSSESLILRHVMIGDAVNGYTFDTGYILLLPTVDQIFLLKHIL
jgi:hypothetical protein